MFEPLSFDILKDIANTYGTPVYVYHAEQIAHQYHRLQSAFQHCHARFFYACKSLTNVNILKYIHALGAHLDCVSIQ